MRAHAQRDGRPAESTWRPELNAVDQIAKNKKRKPLKFAGVPQTRQPIGC